MGSAFALDRGKRGKGRERWSKGKDNGKREEKGDKIKCPGRDRKWEEEEEKEKERWLHPSRKKGKEKEHPLISLLFHFRPLPILNPNEEEED